ncbi:hypothetical protein [Segatella oris]|jgi:hypothetical protein|uniref:hypothetical protein n=1 Tax=Segatella oris TaxID=28135 RepID=UPI00241E1652|nr:hypothetical protein [Segatella oris]
MTQLVITIKDDKIIPYLKKVLEAISGVVNVKTCSEKTETIVDPDTGWTLNDDIVSDVVAYRSGKDKGYLAKDADDLFAQLDA